MIERAEGSTTTNADRSAVAPQCDRSREAAGGPCVNYPLNSVFVVSTPLADLLPTCPAQKLLIELDGGQHALREMADQARDAELTVHGYRVVRFWNNDVLSNTAGVIEAILRELGKS